MILVEMYTKDDCHLCEIAKGVLKKVQSIHPFELKVVNIDEDDSHFEQYKERIPVIFIEHEFAFQHRVPEKEFLDRLRNQSSSKP